MTNLETVTLDDIDLTDASLWEKAAPHDWLDRLRSEVVAVRRKWWIGG